MALPGLTLVFFAVPEEAKPFLRLRQEYSQAEVIVTGMGRNNSTRSFHKAVERKRPARVLTCGFAGGLDPALSRGAVIFSTLDGSPLHALLLGAGARPGRIHCAERVAVTVAEKNLLREATGADAVEMESGVIQDLCGGLNIPCATVRVVSDSAGEDLPIDFNALMTPDHRLDFKKLAWSLMKSPGKIPGLMRLQRNTAAAANSLAAVLTQVLRG
ncbi:MAG: hypothetical protein H7X97_08945 [Opitutaceae bacterium]|nr:hypothetical protein [Verrucomicrobiales bacterium]